MAALKRVTRAGADAAARLEAAAPALARDLARDATALCADADTLCSEWEVGAALADAGAADGRATLARFADALAARASCWTDLAAGQAVYGLPVTKHAGLDKMAADVAGLTKLYG